MAMTDGRDLVWQQGYDRVDLTGYSRLELWTAPYTTDASTLVPRRVAVLDQGFLQSSADLFGGYAVVPSTRTRVVVYPLDGTPPRAVDAPAGFEWGDVVFSGPEEVALLLVQPAPRMPIEVRFYRYDSLPLAE